MVDVAAGALALGALLAFRATRASARLAELRSDFVSTVTHELKTPIASIRAMGDTLARDRIADPAARAEYAQTIVQESKRLSRLIDNLLAYSRITDVTEAYSFEPVDVHALVEEVLQGFSPQLSQQQFEVHVEIARGLPRVRGDRTALRLMLENIVDNAIRYSGESRWVGLAAYGGFREVHDRDPRPGDRHPARTTSTVSPSASTGAATRVPAGAVSGWPSSAGSSRTTAGRWTSRARSNGARPCASGWPSPEEEREEADPGR